MNIKQYINNKRQYISPRVRVIEFEAEGLMDTSIGGTGSDMGGDGGSDVEIQDNDP